MARRIRRPAPQAPDGDPLDQVTAAELRRWLTGYAVTRLDLDARGARTQYARTGPVSVSADFADQFERRARALRDAEHDRAVTELLDLCEREGLRDRIEDRLRRLAERHLHHRRMKEARRG